MTHSPRHGGALVTWALAAAMALPSAGALAQGDGKSRVAVIAPLDGAGVLAEVSTRVVAELRAAGFDVVSVSPTGGGPRDEVEAAIRTAGAFAAIAIEQLDGGEVVDVWWADGVTGKTLVRRFANPEGAPRSSPSVLAVRAVELLRASLIEGSFVPVDAHEKRESSGAEAVVPRDVAEWMAPTLESLREREPPLPEARGSAPPTAGRERPPRRARPRFVLALGPSFSWVRGAGIGGGPAARAAVVFPVGLSVHASLTGPLFGHVVSADGAEATLRMEILEGELGYTIRVVERRLDLETRIGAGAHHLRAGGEAEPPRETRDEDVWAVSLSASVGAVLWLGEIFALDLSVNGFFSAPPVHVVFAGKIVAQVNAPAVVTSLGLRAAL